ncbi:radical SAM protein [Streptomyces netropsis]|uniref:SpcY n=1 Tax=Streptomyces netropsis TaxID=55404 RepID=Q9S1L5_STRNE|nr:SpcY [Streptomyces netropsis]
MSVHVEHGKVINPEGVEINASLQCNMRCKSCAHLSPLFRKENADPAETHDILTLLARNYHASYAKIMGGEPLLHPDIVGLIEAVRTSRVADTVLVATNGTLLDRASEEFWRAVDSLEISVYPSRPLTSEQIDRYHGMAREYDVSLLINHYGHFREIYSETGADSPELVQDVYDTCKLAHYWRSHTVYDGWLYRCPQSLFVPQQLENGGWDPREDGIEIADDPGFLERLHRFLTRTTPLRACGNCLGSVGRLHQHTELARKEWRPKEKLEELIDYEFLELCKSDITTDDGCVDSSSSVSREAG